MKKLMMALCVSVALALSLGACASNTTDQSTTNDDTSAQNTENDAMVENIDLALQNVSLRFDHVEKANEKLTDYQNALVFVFDFTNNQDKPAECQNVFRIQFFQHNSELDDNVTYSSSGGEQYNLVHAFYNDALQGGSVTFGKIVVPKDDTPITIVVQDNGLSNEDAYQSMEVPIASFFANGDESATNSTDDVNAALQGTWNLGDQGVFTFDAGSITIQANNTTMTGTYEIDPTQSTINGHLDTTDRTANIALPYEYRDGVLRLFNNRGAEITKEQ